ncbi:hypothetical protein JI666_14570 [Bacillus sp. NTK071]|uniref:hypothetical protein n=1 Tax=Bacillus sp. NTK071 TaxID=2802175 RepID=UPI001A8D06EE|nr:hypothetical protein [Bacillus sp. NTK071]MBN8209976.1 hypothetical protein [Bacillus sp. NTK071]
MTNIAFGIVLLLANGLVQYSWFFDANNGVAIDFKSKRSYVITTILLTLFTIYLLVTGISSTFY